MILNQDFICNKHYSVLLYCHQKDHLLHESKTKTRKPHDSLHVVSKKSKFRNAKENGKHFCLCANYPLHLRQNIAELNFQFIEGNIYS